MPDQDKYGPARLDGSPLGFGRPAVPKPRSGINAASDLTGPLNLQGIAQGGGVNAASDLTGRTNLTGTLQERPRSVAPAPAPTGVGGLNQAIDASAGVDPASFQIPQERPKGPSPFDRFVESVGASEAPSNIVGGVPAEYLGGQTDGRLPAVKDKGAASVPIGTADTTQARNRDIASGAVPAGAQTPAEQAAAAAGGTNPGVQGASESQAASSAALNPQIVQPARGGTGLVPADAGAIPEGAIEVIRGAPFGRGQTTRSFATQGPQGNFFESTDPRSSIQQGQIAGATRNPGSVESAQNTALLGQSNPRSAGIVAAQNEGQLDREGKVAVQRERNKGGKDAKGNLPDMQQYILDAMATGSTEEEALQSYYIEYADELNGAQ